MEKQKVFFLSLAMLWGLLLCAMAYKLGTYFFPAKPIQWVVQAPSLLATPSALPSRPIPTSLPYLKPLPPILNPIPTMPNYTPLAPSRLPSTVPSRAAKPTALPLGASPRPMPSTPQIQLSPGARPSVPPILPPKFPSPSVETKNFANKPPIQYPDASHRADWIKPVAGPITNAFGNGYQYFGFYRGGHTGIDIKAPTDSPVQASAEGEVVKVHARWDRKYGFYVVLKHPNGYYSLYGHLKKITVKQGQKLSQGHVLGTVGVTGAAGYPHLHFEVLDQVPIAEGAYGYYYICQKRPTEKTALEEYNFVNVFAKEIHVVQRLRSNQCIPRKLFKPVVYYNPEYFFQSSIYSHWPLERQPENEELKRWKHNPKEAPHQEAFASPQANQRRL